MEPLLCKMRIFRKPAEPAFVSHMQLFLNGGWAVGYSPAHHYILNIFVGSNLIACRMSNFSAHQSLLDTPPQVAGFSNRQAILCASNLYFINARLLIRHNDAALLCMPLNVQPRMPLRSVKRYRLNMDFSIHFGKRFRRFSGDPTLALRREILGEFAEFAMPCHLENPVVERRCSALIWPSYGFNLHMRHILELFRPHSAANRRHTICQLHGFMHIAGAN